MTTEYVAIDIAGKPELKQLAEEVRRTGRPVALKEGGVTVAVVRPAPKRGGAGRPGRAKASAGRSRAPWEDNPALRQQMEEDLRANREMPVDRAALFPPHSPEELERRKRVVEAILANRQKRVIAPLTSADLVHLAREQEEDAYGFGR